MRLLFSEGFDRDSFVGSWHLAVNLRVVRPVAMKRIFRAREANSEERLMEGALKRAHLSAIESIDLCVYATAVRSICSVLVGSLRNLEKKENGYYGI